jgi:hypothetical protein
MVSDMRLRSTAVLALSMVTARAALASFRRRSAPVRSGSRGVALARVLAFALQPHSCMTPVAAVACEAPPLQPMSFPAGPLSARSFFAATLLALVYLGAVVQRPRAMAPYAETKVDVARFTVMKYAYEAYPQWAMAHPSRTCPSSLRELRSYLDRYDAIDPYGQRYAFTCQAGAFFAMSFGEDGIANTADDIWSHQ